MIKYITLKIHTLVERGVRTPSGSSIAEAISGGDNSTSPQALVYLIDSDFTVKYVSDSVAEQFHCKSCDLLGKSVWAILGRMTSKTGKDRLMNTLSTGNPFQSTTEVTFPAGQRMLSTVLFPIKNSKGNISQILGVSYDITGSHERDQLIRNKMEIIIGYAEILSGIVVDDEAKKMVDKIRDASTHLHEKLDASSTSAHRP